MSDLLHIPADEHSRIRLFALDMGDGEFETLKHPKSDKPSTAAAVAYLLGLDWLNPDYFELFPLSDLEGVGLAGYLNDGNGVSEDQLDRPQLKTLQGYVLIVYSKAFEGSEATLRPTRQVLPVALYSQPQTDWSGAPIKTASARPGSGVQDAAAAQQMRLPWGIMGIAALITFGVALVIKGLI